MTVTEFSAVAALEFRNVKKGIESFSRVKFISCRTKFRFISLARANFWTFLINKSWDRVLCYMLRQLPQSTFLACLFRDLRLWSSTHTISSFFFCFCMWASSSNCFSCEQSLYTKTENFFFHSVNDYQQKPNKPLRRNLYVLFLPMRSST